MFCGGLRGGFQAYPSVVSSVGQCPPSAMSALQPMLPTNKGCSFRSVVSVVTSFKPYLHLFPSDCCGTVVRVVIKCRPWPRSLKKTRDTMEACVIPSVSSLLQMTNCSFTYVSPDLWSQLPSFRQPHSVHCPPGSPHPVHITSSQSPPSLSSSTTASTFHSRLKTHQTNQ